MNYSSHKIWRPYFPKLKRCDVLVDDGLRRWHDIVGCGGSEIYIRMVDAKSGEWFDEESEGPYMDYCDNSCALDREHDLDDIWYTRNDYEWDEENEEDVRMRYEAMVKIKEEGLPRIDLKY